MQESSTSRWEDMKLSCFLLGNAFRVDSGKPPEKVKQVKEAKVRPPPRPAACHPHRARCCLTAFPSPRQVFFSEVTKLQKAAASGARPPCSRACRGPHPTLVALAVARRRMPGRRRAHACAVAGNKKQAAISYAAAKEALEIYLNDVELPCASRSRRRPMRSPGGGLAGAGEAEPAWARHAFLTLVAPFPRTGPRASRTTSRRPT